MTVRLALYRPHKWWDIGGRLICAWTRSPHSHCELVIGDMCYSSSIRDGGVRRKRIDLSGAQWDVLDLPWVGERHVTDLFGTTNGQPYGWLDLLSQHVLRLPWHQPEGWLCSEWCAMGMGLPRPETWTPGALGEYARTRQ